LGLFFGKANNELGYDTELPYLLKYQMRSHLYFSMRAKLLSLLFVSLFHSLSSLASEQPTNSVDNLMVVLRESVGANKLDEALKPMGKGKFTLADGKEFEADMGWFLLIGDMHIRFVFDGPKIMANATPKEISDLKLTPEQAMQVAVSNIKRVYGNPVAVPWDDFMQVKGKSPDLDSSYFLDREFWRTLVKKHPEGVVVSVAKRGGLLYVPLSNAKAVEGLRKGVAYLHSSSGRFRISSALYLFKDDKWSVFQSAVKE
jgi:hypothetical protein